MQYDMSITNETLHQPKPEPIPAAAPTHPTTVTQRRPAQFDQGSGNYNGMGSGSYLSTGQQYTGASVGAGQSAGSGQYAGIAPGQYSGSGQFNAVSQPAYTGSPRFSSTPVDWGSSTTSATPAAGPAYTPTDSLSQQSGMYRYRHQHWQVNQDRCIGMGLFGCYLSVPCICVIGHVDLCPSLTALYHEGCGAFYLCF